MRPTSKSVSIVLDKERHIRIDLNALAKFEEVTGETALGGDVWEYMNARRLRAILWVALLHEDPALTIEQVGEMIHAGNAREVMAQINKAFIAAVPDPSGEAEGDGKNVPSPTG